MIAIRAKKICSKSLLKEIILLVFVGLLVGFTYRKLPYTFFQQDEWYSLGRYYVARSKDNISTWFSSILAGSSFGHFNPLVQVFNIAQYTFFGLNFKAYAYTSILLHIINAVSVYILAKLLSKKNLWAFLISLVFAVNSIHHQAITWIAAYAPTQLAFFFAVWSIIYFIKFQKNLSFRTLLACFILLLVSLGFRESVLFLFLFYPLWAYFDKGPKISKKVFRLSLIFLFIFSTPRLLLLLIPQSFPGEENPGLSAVFLLKLVYRLLTTPLKALAQVFIPAEWIIKASEGLVAIANPFINLQRGTTIYDITTQTVVSDLVSYAIAMIIIGIVFLAYFYLRKNRKANEARLLLGSLVFILLSSLPYIFIPGSPGDFSFLDSRYLYLPSLGASIFLVLVIDVFANVVSTKKFKPITVVFLIFIFCLFHYHRVQGILAESVEAGQERKQILEKILITYPRLDKKSVFYTESTKSFYGQPPEEKMLPFQSGPGQMLLVWYSFHGEKFPTCFFEDDFLWGILSQGYKECEGRGFGYFRNYKELVEAVEKYELKPENIYAFRYDAQVKKLENITDVYSVPGL